MCTIGISSSSSSSPGFGFSSFTFHPSLIMIQFDCCIFTYINEVKRDVCIETFESFGFFESLSKIHTRVWLPTTFTVTWILS